MCTFKINANSDFTLEVTREITAIFVLFTHVAYKKLNNCLEANLEAVRTYNCLLMPFQCYSQH